MHLPLILALAITSLSSVAAQISRQECQDQGGTVVGDIGDGAIFEPGYICEVNGQAPSHTIVPQEGEPIAIEGEVCCGGERPFITRQECTEQGGLVVGDIGNAAIFREEYRCESNDQPPIANINQEGEENIAREGEVCCGGTDDGVLVPGEALDDGNDSGALPGSTKEERPFITRQECTEQGGLIVGDIGNGAIFEEEYLCESDDQPPIANVNQEGEDNIAIEGEVCCGGTDEGAQAPGEDLEDEDAVGVVPVVTSTERPFITRQECTEQGGLIVGDIGNSAIFREEYRCESNSQPPIANVNQEGEDNIAKEGEVCCGDTDDGVQIPGKDLDNENDMDVLPGSNNAEKSSITRQECTEQGGLIVGDIGNGAIFEEEYLCESNDQPPIANVNQEGEDNIAIEGEVCCGPPLVDDTTSGGKNATSNDSDTMVNEEDELSSSPENVTSNDSDTSMLDEVDELSSGAWHYQSCFFLFSLLLFVAM